MKTPKFLFRTTIAISIVAAMTSPAYSRLGENREECVKRYEKIHETVNDPDPSKKCIVDIYNKNGIEIRCYMHDGKVVNISFVGAINLMSLGKASALVELNSQGAKWSKPYQYRGNPEQTQAVNDIVGDIDVSGSHVQWSRDDGGCAAYKCFNTKDGKSRFSLNIYNPSWDAELAERNKTWFKKAIEEPGDIKDF